MLKIKHPRKEKQENNNVFEITNNQFTRSANFLIIIATECSIDIVLVSIITSGCSGA